MKDGLGIDISKLGRPEYWGRGVYQYSITPGAVIGINLFGLWPHTTPSKQNSRTIIFRFYPREQAMLARVYILLCCCCCCCGGGGCFTQLLRISSWLHVKSFIANFVMDASRVVVCRVNIRVDLRIQIQI
jgi:hypothetical protein